MNIKKCGYACLLIIVSFNTVYAYKYKGKKEKETVAHSEQIIPTKHKKVAQAKKDTQSSSFLANLRRKFAGASDRLRPSRSERIQIAQEKAASKKA